MPTMVPGAAAFDCVLHENGIKPKAKVMISKNQLNVDLAYSVWWILLWKPLH